MGSSPYAMAGRAALAGSAILGILILVPPARAADFLVTSPADVHDATPNGVCETAAGNGVCTLRAAFEEADQRVGQVTTIEIAPTVPLIQLSLGAIAVDQSVELTGQGLGSTRIERLSGSAANRFLTLTGGEIVLRRLTVANFATPDDFFEVPDGGAILAWTSLTVEECAFENNSADEKGGAIAFDGLALEVRRTSFYGDDAQSGGAIALEGPFRVEDSIFEGEYATAGGALWVGPFAEGEVDRSFFADNASVDGGAIAAHRSVRILNSTLTGNHATNDGGGIHYYDDATQPDLPLYVLNSTIAGNDSNSNQGFDGGQGGGVFVEVGTVALSNSILAGNWEWVSDGVCCFEPYVLECRGSLTSNGYNIVRYLDANCSVAGSESNADPGLLPAAYNGGFTRTLGLPPGSAAIGAGHPSGCVDELGAPVAEDQRGAVRPSGGGCDLGAFEYGALIFDDGFEPFGTGRWTPGPT